MLLASNMADCDRSWTCELRIARARATSGSGGLCGRRPTRPATARYAPTSVTKSCRVTGSSERLSAGARQRFQRGHEGWSVQKEVDGFSPRRHPLAGQTASRASVHMWVPDLGLSLCARP
eukprot:6750909-Prymnesium_polylepis.1